MTFTEAAAREGSRDRPGALFWAAFVWALLGALLVVMGAFAKYYDYFPSDVFIAHRMQRIDVPAFGGYIDVVNFVGMTWVATGLAFGFAIGFALRRAVLEGVFLLLTFAPRLATNALKDAIERPRPAHDLVHVAGHASGYSFPSGHAVGTSALFGVLLFVLPAAVPARPLCWLLQLGCLLLVASAGPARVFIGVHWPSDVLGGYLLALLFLIPAYLAYRSLTRGRSRSRPEAGVLD